MLANREFTAVRESILIMEDDPGAIVIECVSFRLGARVWSCTGSYTTGGDWTLALTQNCSFCSRDQMLAPEMSFTEMKVPRRPSWDASTTPDELNQKEKESFMAWRRDIAMYAPFVSQPAVASVAMLRH